MEIKSNIRALIILCIICFKGSPFRPRVLDARKVKCQGGWRTFLDANNMMNLQVNESKTIEFDVSEAGPGILVVFRKRKVG